jgi:hypothetical protein
MSCKKLLMSTLSSTTPTPIPIPPTSTSTVVMQIEDFLSKYRASIGITLEHLSPDDISALKGYHVRSTKVQEMDYRRGWAKLGMAQKLNRLMVYHQKLTTDYTLDTMEQGQLKKLFYDGIGSSILDREQVSYNSNEGTIVNIDGLKRGHDGIFFLENSMHQTGTHATKPIQKFVPASVIQLSDAQKRKKPVIVIKEKIKVQIQSPHEKK